MRRLTRIIEWMFAPTMMVLGASTAMGQAVSTGSGQVYPSKPIRIVTTPVGGGVDFVTRIIAQGISAPLGQQVLVDNQSTQVYAEVASRAPPDGYTLLMSGGGAITRPLLSKVSYDPIRDFSPVTLAVISPIFIVVHPSVPVHSVKDLIALAKARPGELNFGSPGTGSSNHLAAELFKSMARVDMVHIPYKGGGPALNDLVAGHVQLMFATASEVIPQLKTGRLKALAVTSAQRSALVPDLPTVAASGLPGYQALSLVGTFAPAKTPTPVINRLNQEIVQFLRTDAAKEKFSKAGIETVGSSPEEFGATVKSEITRLGKVIQDIGIRAD